MEEKIKYDKEISVYIVKIKRRIVISLVSFIVFSFGLFFERNSGLNIERQSVLVILLMVCMLLLTGFLLLLYISKSKTLEFTRKKKDLHTLYGGYNIVHIMMNLMIFVIIFQMLIMSSGTVYKTSMEPSYSEGDRILIYHLYVQYERFDVVVLDVAESQRPIIKRIIGLPGETIHIKDGSVYVDGELLDESAYLGESVSTYCNVTGSVDVNLECMWEVPENEYFLMGDHREGSVDSRYFGLKSKNDFQGKVLD